MLSPPPSPSPSFSTSTPPQSTCGFSVTTPSLLFPPSPFSWSASLPDSPLSFSSAFPPASPPAFPASPHTTHSDISASSSSSFCSSSPASLSSFSLPAAVKSEPGGRSSSHLFSSSQSHQVTSAVLTALKTTSASTAGLSYDSSGTSSPHFPSSSQPAHPAILVSCTTSPPHVASSSAASSSCSAAVDATAASFHTICAPILTFLRSHFDAMKAPSVGESQHWRHLLSSSAASYSRAQAEVGELHEHFDEILRRLSTVYERQLVGYAEERLEGKMADEAITAIRAIADKFTTARQAVLHLHITQLISSSQHTSSSSSIPIQLSSSSSSSSSYCLSPHPLRPPRKPKRVSAPPPNSTSSKRAYFDKSCTAVLKRWLSCHMDDPYPNSDRKAALAAESGLSYDQVQHWFINARMRKWRPMLRRKKEEEERKEEERRRWEREGMDGQTQQHDEEAAQQDGHMADRAKRAERRGRKRAEQDESAGTEKIDDADHTVPSLPSDSQ